MAVSNNIFVYKGAGTDETCFKETFGKLEGKYGKKYSVIQVDTSYIAREARPKVFVFPGGKAGLMGGQLKIVAEKVNRSVRSGSGLLGFCAGAMVASSHWSYILPTKLDSKGIGFFNVPKEERFNLGPSAFAPAFVEGDVDDDLKEPSARLAEIYLPHSKEYVRCFWSQGPIFSTNDETVVLAEYKASNNSNIKEVRDAAIIQSSLDYGDFVFLGVHPELAEWCNDHFCKLSQEDLKLNDKLFEECCKLVKLEV